MFLCAAAALTSYASYRFEAPEGHRRFLARKAAVCLVGMRAGSDSASPPEGENVRSAGGSDYESEIVDWRTRRAESLRSDSGWLSLAGLFWLKEGENRFGSDPENDIVFPEGKAPGVIGCMILGAEELRVRIEPGVDVRHEGATVTEMRLRTDTGATPTVLEHGTLSWYVIQREGRYAVRLKDRRSPNIVAFRGIDYYPIDPAWRIQAIFEPYDPPRKIPIATIVETTIEQTSPGALVFEIAGERYRLDPLAEPDDEIFFVMFADRTSGNETYGAGRYLSVERPGPDGTTVVDFNKAYNPPCAFTEFATCPLPPPQNRLLVAVTAGEKSYESTNYEEVCTE
jgi:uncharacterized protein (DUF1684 family)